MVNFTAFTWSSQKLLVVHYHIYPDVYFLFIFPHYGWQVPLTLVFMSSCFSFIFCSKFFGIPFLFGLTVPQHCTVLVCKSPNKETVYIVCPTFYSLAGSPVTVAWIVVIEGLTHCLFLPKYTGILYIYTLELQSLWIFILNIYCVSLVCTVWKWLSC